MLLAALVAFSAMLAFATVPAFADDDDEDELVGTFDWLFGEDLDLLFFGGIVFGPVAAVDEDGNRIEMSGSGTFTLGSESVTGGGTYKIFDAIGNVIAEGEWEMTEFEDYEDFGGFPDPLGILRGGVLEAEIELDGLSEGEIVINCNILAPPDHPLIEGVTVETEDMDFDEALPPDFAPLGGGITLFIGP